MSSTTLTVGTTEGIGEGGTLTIYVPDTRWWKRLYHWLFLLRPPTRPEHYTVMNVDSSTTVTIAPKNS